MPRDFLLFLVFVGVALNIALLAGVAWANHRTLRGRLADSRDPGIPVAADDMDPARLIALGAGLVDRDWVETQLGVDASGDAQPEAPVTAEESAASGPGTRSASRRRHRARRPAGAALPHTDLVLSLGPDTPDGRLVLAVSGALRATVRGSDQVVELPGGRLRVSLEADERGGEAVLQRARTVVRPWLGVFDPELDLRVEGGQWNPEPGGGVSAR